MSERYNAAIELAIQTLIDIAIADPKEIGASERRAAAVAAIDALGQRHVQDAMYENDKAED